MTFHCNRYQTPRRSGPIGGDESQSQGAQCQGGRREARGVETGPESRRGQNVDLPTYCEGLGLEYNLFT